MLKAGNHYRKSRVVLAYVIAPILLSGCSYQVLTFFFTGVPDPNNVEVIADSTAGSAVIGEQDEVSGYRPHLIPDQRTFTHGPWVNKRCDVCHQSGSGKRFNMAGGRSISGGFILEEKELCLSCHDDKQFRNTSDELWLHGPVANGKCTNCHNPHESARRFMLTATNDIELCSGCHNDQDIHVSRPVATATGAECTVCHNPHASRQQYLLRADTQ